MKGRYLPHYGTKYLLKENGVLYAMDRNGDYKRVAVSSDKRVRLYHRGKESRVSLRTLYKRVWGDEMPPEPPVEDLATVLREDEKTEHLDALDSLLDWE